jgi:hypothetical protein
VEIFKLFGTILVDTVKANESISKTGKEADSLASKLGNGLQKGADIAGKAMLALGAAAVAGGTALYGLTMKTAETLDRVDKLSAKIGISKQAFQEWDYIMGQSGMDVSKLQVGVKTLVTQMTAASKGSESAQSAFKKLNVTWQDSWGRLKSQEEVLNETILALAKMGNTTERARLATELFGKAGSEMAPMLNGGAEAIEALRKRAHELGLIFSDDAVNASVVLGDTIDDVKRSFSSLTTQIGVAATPAVQKFADFILENMPEIRDKTAKALEVITNIAMFLIDNGKAVTAVIIGISTAIAVLKTTIAISNLMGALDKISASGHVLFAKVAKWTLIIVGITLAITGLIMAINTLLGKGKQAAQEVDSIQQITSTVKQNTSIPGYANGTDYHKGGLAIVGEKGPELVNLPRGSQVYTNEETKDMLGGTTNYYITIPASDIKEFNDIIRIAENQKRISRMGEVTV